MILRQGMRIFAIGLVPGLAVGFAAATGLRSMFEGITEGQIAAATLIPARRAASIDPLLAIRSD
jgi:hypothetical protein